MRQANVSAAIYGFFGLVFLGQGCASILGIETPGLDPGIGGNGGDAAGQGGMAGQGQGGMAGQGQGGMAGQGQGGMAGAGGSTGGSGGQGGMPCVPKTCLEMQKDCGMVDDGCGTPIPCGDCPFGKVCGHGQVANVCGGTLVVRNGYVAADGLKSYSQICDVLVNGTVDCTDATHIFTQAALPPTGITPDPGTHIQDRFGVSYVVGSSQKAWLGYLQSDGLKEWSIICDINDGGIFDCAMPAHMIVTTNLPVMNLNLDPNTHVSGRYTYAYRVAGALKIRNGFVQSDGLKTHSQTCDVLADGTIACDPTTHLFSTFGLPPADIAASIDAAQFISDRFAYVTPNVGGFLLASGFMQADGKKSFVQTCGLDATTGILDCAMKPFTVETVPGSLAADAFSGRFAFEYVK